MILFVPGFSFARRRCFKVSTLCFKFFLFFLRCWFQTYRLTSAGCQMNGQN
jgi:hypothetical protein